MSEKSMSKRWKLYEHQRKLQLCMCFRIPREELRERFVPGLLFRICSPATESIEIVIITVIAYYYIHKLNCLLCSHFYLIHLHFLLTSLRYRRVLEESLQKRWQMFEHRRKLHLFMFVGFQRKELSDRCESCNISLQSVLSVALFYFLFSLLCKRVSRIFHGRIYWGFLFYFWQLNSTIFT